MNFFRVIIMPGNLDGTAPPKRPVMLADQRRHAPCGFVGDAKLALQFLAANTVLGRSE